MKPKNVAKWQTRHGKGCAGREWRTLAARERENRVADEIVNLKEVSNIAKRLS